MSDTAKYSKMEVESEDFTKIHPLIEEAIRTQKTQHVEYKLTKSDGKKVWIRRKFTAIPQEKEGDYLLVSVTDDITDQKENERNETERREALARIISNVPFGIVVYKYKGESLEIIEINPAMCKMVGNDEKNIVGADLEKILSQIFSEDREDIRKMVRILHEPGLDDQREFRYYTKETDEFKWFSIRGRSVKGKDGEIYIYASYIDITEEKRLQSVQLELESAKKAS